ncbi:MAG: O-antigen ligase family protein [Proteobacteria bacterium]|nr:O-antigen ligase family protein [Pseudomonadota bacterium]
MRQRELTTAILASLTVGFALAALGSVPRWAVCVAALLALATAVPQVASRRSARKVSPLMVFLALAAGFTALQLIPLPAFLVGFLSPVKLDIVRDNALALGLPEPGFAPLSYDPPATWVELAKIIGYLAFVFATTRLAMAERGRQWLIRTVAISGCAMAACAVLHDLFDMDTLLGIYRPQSRPAQFLAPLISENHLAGFLTLTVPLMLALAIESSGSWRVLWLTGVLGSAGVVLLTRSRGGAVALAVAVLLCAVLFPIQRRRRLGRRRRRRHLKLDVLVPAGVVAACVAIVLVTLVGGGVRDEFAATSSDEIESVHEKPGIWRTTRGLIDDNLWTGVGRGAFEVAFARVHPSGIKTYSHAENEYLQAIVDWGMPAAAALGLVMLWTVVTALRRWDRSLLETGVVCGVAALCAQNFVDFNLELPGVALAALAAVAILLPQQLKRSTASPGRVPALRIAGLAVGASVVLVAASPLGRSFHDEGDELRALIAQVDSRSSPESIDREYNTDEADRVPRRDGANSAEGSAGSSAEAPIDRGAVIRTAITRGTEMVQRHPSDYLIAGLTAKAYFLAGDERALKLMNRALALNPNHAGLHVLTAKMLVGGNRLDQALIEFTLALGQVTEPVEILRDLLRMFPEPEQAARGIPTSAGRVTVMARRLEIMGRADVALAYVRRAMADNPSSVEITEEAARLALKHGELQLAMQAGEHLYERRGRIRDALAFARALKAGARLREAHTVLTDALDRNGSDGDARQTWTFYTELGDVELALGLHREARRRYQKALALAGSQTDLSVSLYRKLAAIEKALGNTDLAGEMHRRASELEAGR